MARACLSHLKPSSALDINAASGLAPLPLVLLLPDLAHLSGSERFNALKIRITCALKPGSPVHSTATF